ncbi:MAG: LegC family aminotransferase [Clostridiales Family XIII bacterium]|nr:LegC family aminotransferase [Clostridiales Family XIII bacterium]
MREIPLSVPNLDADIVDNLKECVETGWISTGGRFIGEFEAAVADYVGVRGAVGCQSGTAGLHVALRILGVMPGDEVIVPTLTFIAAVNPVFYQGAEPIFMDCDPRFCVDPDKLEKFCAEECRLTPRGLINKNSGKRVAALVVVHVFGNLADMGRIMDIANKYRIRVLEDATEALGSFYGDGALKGKHAGVIGDIGVFSFNANKIITTGGGGMIVANDADILAQARYLTTTAKDDGLYFVHDSAGYNYRMLNIQAAFGVSQIKRIEEFVGIKTHNFNVYKERLEAMGVVGLNILPFSENIRSNHWFYSFSVDEREFGMSRDALMARLIDAGIQCRPVWRLCHKQKPYENARSYMIRQAERFERTVLNLPCSTNLSEDDVGYVCKKIADLRNDNIASA